MSSKAATRRLNVVARSMRALPFQKQAIDHAYAKLLQAGELPADDRLAWSVLERALYARRSTVDGRCIEARVVVGDPIDGPPRRRVFCEAVHSFAPARIAARELIKMLVAAGQDPTDAEFIPSDIELPDFGGAAMHLLGWPDQWVRPQYVPQMQRVMRQHADVLGQVDGSDGWHREAAAGLGAFLTRGELPAEQTVRLFALTVGEMFALHADALGRGNQDLLAAYAAVATSLGAEQQTALEHLCRLQARAEARR